MDAAQKPLVIVFLGSIGSGKSFFARQLAKKLCVVRINSDAMRHAMGETWGDEANRRLWGAGDYVVEQILAAKHHVIYDAARFNRIEARKRLYEVAEKVGALLIIVWIETSREVAAERAEKRELTDDQRPFTKAEVEEIIANHEKKFNAPRPHELVIRVSGELSFEQQYESFTKQLEGIIN